MVDGMSDLNPDQYNFHVPSGAVALRPASPRDQAKLCVIHRDTNRVEDTTFRQLGSSLPPCSVLVFNDTKVIPARLRAYKTTGGRVEVLYLSHDRHVFRALADRRLKLDEKLRINRQLELTVIARQGSVVTLRPSIAMRQFLKRLERSGRTPLPPYLRTSPLTEPERRRLYQTVFAKKSGSVAAPTASLHFTPRVLRALRSRGFSIQYVTLHVGLGTFAPLTEEQLRTNRLHQETFHISVAAAARLNAAKRAKRPIIAVGTTVARTLESATRRGRIIAGAGETSLFIRPGYRWKFVDGLITNFHVPRSSLMMLVAAFVGRRRLLDLYRRAIIHGYKLYSFGDGMLIV